MIVLVYLKVNPDFFSVEQAAMTVVAQDVGSLVWDVVLFPKNEPIESSDG